MLGILNSKLILFWFQQNYKSLAMAGGYFNMGPKEMKCIPIPDLNISNLTALLSSVDKIIAQKADDASNDTSNLERKVDCIVYKLYNLTQDEIDIVEGVS